ncbi:MAG: hypothetical protein MUF48_05660 [Pirellulaceae bacterium]|nr:hypothetical protein [Pirellulaceae bacterium]
MDVLQQQVRRAARCLFRNQLVTNCTWSLLAGLLVALAAILASKWWPLAVDARTWAIGWWVAGGLGGLVAGVAWAWLRRPTLLEAALEIDLRYGLHERVSSAVVLAADTRSTELGQALIDDAARRAQGLNVREQFRPRWNWHIALPIGAALLALLAALLPVRASRNEASAAADSASSQQQVRESLQELRKRLARRKEQQPLDPESLQEAEGLLAKFEKAVDELDESNAGRKEALVKLNNLSKELAELRKDWEASEKLRDQLQQLEGLQQGPADRVAGALQAGDLAQAGDELRELSEKLRNDQLTAEQREQLASQLQELAQAMEQVLDARQELEQQLRELSQQVRQLQQQGDQAAAGQLQQKLEQTQRQLADLDAQNPQLGQLQNLAQQLQEGADATRDGKTGQAAESVTNVADNLQQSQREIKNADLADSLLREISDAKNAMHCDQCGGRGCEACQNPEMAVAVRGPRIQSNQPGRGLDSGPGMGARPEQETATGGVRTRVDAEPRPGEAVRAGDTSGPNLPGTSHESIKQEIASAFSEDPDPLVQQQLPRHEREQSKEYFELLRGGR